jgi:hypothetical protein
MTARLRRRVAERRAGLLHVLLNHGERAACDRAAAAAGVSVTAWARQVLLDTVAAGGRPPATPPARRLVEGDVPRRRGRPAIVPVERREYAFKIGLTLGERARVDRAARSAGRPVATWARAALRARLDSIGVPILSVLDTAPRRQ